MTETVPPDFAVQAARLLSASDPLAAARLSTAGISCYPDYAGGYVMLAKAYAALGRGNDAITMVQDARERFPYITITLPDVFPAIAEPHTEVLDHEIVAVSEVTTEVDVPSGDSVAVATTNDEPSVFLESELESTLEAGMVTIDRADSSPSEVVAEEPVLDVEMLPAEAPSINYTQTPSQVLRMIETLPVATDARIIRSSSVRLIPGLEFTTLRVEGLRSRGRRGVGSLPEPPAFRTFHQVRRPQRPVEPPAPRKPVSLEELAQRLAEARIPRPTEVDLSAQRPEASMAAQPQPSKVTETISNIYMQHQPYDLAIEAFKHLMSQRPDRKDHFEALIHECERKRG